jgi:hypothetical protein
MAIERQRATEPPKHAAVDTGAARRLLTTPTTSALALLAAARSLLGDEFSAWEPETIWLELERRGLEAPLPNRAKLQAALALVLVPAFYWDAVVFEKTALAFDHVVPNPAALEEATAAQLAWAVREAARIVACHGDSPREFAHEPAAYAGVVLHREGLVVSPEELTFAQHQLDSLNGPGGRDLRDQVSTAWAATDKATLAAQPYPETGAGVQLARLASVEMHVRERQPRAASELSSVEYCHTRMGWRS